ncbi:BON domain-containing protein [Chryseolinea lacunae]|uniref:BON domain-containing protein n=1 Tax=Chryseolinea lacunae TaxID=2801331 RepID=A0ABS1KNX5_9BACT|nr:BON domain-containing protein [Chryseolinea lacunae]MBL0741035.1 BON domain-containing protein [Chryseolinea lacunae]
MKTNTELQNDVMAEFQWDSNLRSVASQIGVAAKDGVITLSGLVDTYSKKIAAERAAQRVQGVRVVASDIEVKIPSSLKKTDTEIAGAIRDALRWNTLVDEGKMAIKVEDGWVTMSGEVEWAFQRLSAEESIENLMGVKGVTNLIGLKTKRIDTQEIKREIAAAFHRSATVDSSAVKLDAQGSRLTLTGTVRSYAEKKEAERIAWSSPGVLTVDNRIGIDSEVFAD